MSQSVKELMSITDPTQLQAALEQFKSKTSVAALQVCAARGVSRGVDEWGGTAMQNALSLPETASSALLFVLVTGCICGVAPGVPAPHEPVQWAMGAFHALPAVAAAGLKFGQLNSAGAGQTRASNQGASPSPPPCHPPPLFTLPPPQPTLSLGWILPTTAPAQALTLALPPPPPCCLPHLSRRQ